MEDRINSIHPTKIERFIQSKMNLEDAKAIFNSREESLQDEIADVVMKKYEGYYSIGGYKYHMRYVHCASYFHKDSFEICLNYVLCEPKTRSQAEDIKRILKEIRDGHRFISKNSQLKVETLITGTYDIPFHNISDFALDIPYKKM